MVGSYTIEETELVYLNNGSPTRITGNSSRSVLDMTLVSPNLASKCNWSVHNDMGSSDHFPTICQLTGIVCEEST